jgi:hypothetical protein
MYWVATVPLKDFHIVEGEEFVRPMKMLPAWDIHQRFSRNFCSECGTRVFNEFYVDKDRSENLLVGDHRAIFPASLDRVPDSYLPTKHAWCSEAVLDLSKLHDNLPRSDTFE